MTSRGGSAGSYAVILAGGGGTRLWPSSRRARPKQLLPLGGSESLLASTVRRVLPIFGIDRILIVTARDQEDAIRAELPALPPDNLLVEPMPRNTAGAIGIAAAVVAARSGGAARLAVLPADHHIRDEKRFRDSIRLALSFAADTIVTVGIEPTSPETGYGYIEVGATHAPGKAGKARTTPKKPKPGAYRVGAFKEKPDRRTAVRYLRSGRFLWNAGMFFLTAERMLAEADRFLPRLGALLRDLAAAASPADLRALLGRRYGEIEAVSIDYGIMEKASGLLVVPGSFGWSDLGSWSAVADIRDGDAQGNVLIGDVLVRDGARNLVIADPGAPFVGVVGADDLVVVATSDGVLVVPRARSQDVRQIVDALKERGRHDLLDSAPARATSPSPPALEHGSSPPPPPAPSPPRERRRGLG